MQSTTHLLMIRPVRFGFNPETAVNNAFQTNEGVDVQAKAQKEFDGFVKQLRAQGIDVTVVEDTPEPYTPDSIFPNNWASFHTDGTLCLYPMFAPNRRLERKQTVLDAISKKFEVKRTIDFSHYEAQGKFLEGTGSMILDRPNKIVYACLSPRTHEDVLLDFANQLGYKAVYFKSYDKNGQLIYHTNVMMCVADRYAIVCLDSITDATERNYVEKQLTDTGKQVITISLDQVNQFAGNMLQVRATTGEPLLAMSNTAYESLDIQQLDQLVAYNKLIVPELNHIETNGGGSARCMLAEVFLPLKK